jgi:hypothetical protein
MIAYLDTSSLLKLYHEESGSGMVENAIAKDIEKIYLSDIAVTDTRCLRSTRHVQFSQNNFKRTTCGGLCAVPY